MTPSADREYSGSTSAVRLLTTAGVVADHAQLVGRRQHWVKTLLRTQSASGREILAHIASGGSLDAEGLEALPDRGDAYSISSNLNIEAAGNYARVLAHQTGAPGNEAAALKLLTFLLAVSPTRVADADRALYAQLLVKHRRWVDLRLFLEDQNLIAGIPQDVVDALLADMENPFLDAGVAKDEAGFLMRLNRVFDPQGPSLVGLRESGTTPFDRLRSHAIGGTEHGPLITVITSAYNPDHALLGAARSVIDQTWANWEMLIVDDASDAPSASTFLSAVEQLDPRIRVIRKAVNGGTYRARNTAMRQARGAFVTFLDSDDWAHPFRLARGVEPMLEQAGILATRTFGTRVTEDLELTRPGYGSHFSTAASLMFRFPDVPARVGFFDGVRKAADTEYILRIEAAFGQPIFDLPGSAMTIARRAIGSLSSQEFSYGWRHPSRWAYKQAYGASHREISAGAPPYREPDEGLRYFGSHRWAKRGDPDRLAKTHFDVVFVGDWRRFGGPQVSMMEEISALRPLGLRVGVMHLEAMRFRTASDDPLCLPLRERLEGGEVELVFVDDDVEIDLMILRYPPILQFPPEVHAPVRPRRLLIMANQAPAEPDGGDQRYVPADVHFNALRLFGTEPKWVPQGPAIREILSGMLPPETLSPWDNPGIVNPDEWHIERGPLPTQGLVVGRYSRDDGIKFPATGQDLLSGYGFPANVKVQFMGARRTVAKLLDDIDTPRPANWLLMGSHAIPAKDFLKSVHVVIYLDHPNAHEAFGRVLLESAASGALVIASRKHEATFGDALVYADPDETVALVKHYVANPDLVSRHCATVRRRIDERWSYRRFADRVLAELKGVAARLDREAEAVAPVLPSTAEVVLDRADLSQAMDFSGGSQQIRVMTGLLRRPADAELADAVAVVCAPEVADVATDLLVDIQARHRPGEKSVDIIDSQLPDGVWAVVLHIDGEWVPAAKAGLRAELVGTRYRLGR